MERKSTLHALVETLKHDALELERFMANRDYGQALVRSRQTLGTASRVHARLLALVEAQEELQER